MMRSERNGQSAPGLVSFGRGPKSQPPESRIKWLYLHDFQIEVSGILEKSWPSNESWTGGTGVHLTLDLFSVELTITI